MSGVSQYASQPSQEPKQKDRGGAIELRELFKSYGSSPFKKEVVHDCSFKIHPGKLNVIIGPSGCGKTTLLKLMAGFERPSSGSVIMDGSSVKGPGPEKLIVFQETALFSWMTNYQNIVFGPRARGVQCNYQQYCAISA